MNVNLLIDAIVRQTTVFLRTEASALRAKVASYNAAHPDPEEGSLGVIAYVGQTIVESDAPGDSP